MDDHSFLTKPVYGLDAIAKLEFLTDRLKQLSGHHYECCVSYKKMLKAMDFNIDTVTDHHNIPFLPVRLFKQHELLSIEKDQITKSMTSSGTTGQQVSKIFLDRSTAKSQTKVLAKIVESFVGKSRLPMIILDSPSVLKDRAMFSARGAGILGFSMFGREKIYALDENMAVNFEGLEFFIEKHKGKQILLFGFTFMIWKYFYLDH